MKYLNSIIMKIQDKIIVVLFCSIAINACGLGIMMYSIHRDTQHMTRQLESHLIILDYQMNSINTTAHRLNYRLFDLEARVNNMPRMELPPIEIPHRTD